MILILLTYSSRVTLQAAVTIRVFDVKCRMSKSVACFRLARERNGFAGIYAIAPRNPRYPSL